MTPEERRGHADALVADWPPLTDGQRARLAVLLHPARPAAAARPRGLTVNNDWTSAAALARSRRQI